MNKCILIGRLANDPEAFTTQSGTNRSTFRLAVPRLRADANGVRQADFFTIVAWRKTADFCNNYLTKGRQISVEGTIQNRSYDAQDGSKRYITEIIAEHIEALGNKGDGQQKASDPGPEPPAETAPASSAGSSDFVEVDDDDLPF